MDHPGERHHVLAPVAVVSANELYSLVLLHKESTDIVRGAVRADGAAEEIGAGQRSGEEASVFVVSVAHIDGHLADHERTLDSRVSGRQATGVEVYIC